MAQVPMPEGPRVNPVVPDAKPISILEPKESRITANAIGGMQNSQNVLVKAANDAYNRMNEARATEAFNSIKIAVTDLMLGENGALRQEGSQVVDRKKPFVDDYMEQIEKISENCCEGLTAEQKRLNQERIRLYVANRRTELLNHSIKQSEIYENGVAKTQSELASDSIVTNPLDIESYKTARADIEKAASVILRGQAPDVIKASVDASVSKSILESITTQIALGNVENAEAIRKHHHGKGLLAVDEMKAQAHIKPALQKKLDAVKEQDAINAVNRSLTPEGILNTVGKKGNGKDFDTDLYKKVSALATENGISNDVIVLQMYYLGEEKSKKQMAEWSAKAREAKEKGEEAPPLPFGDSLSPTEADAVKEYIKIRDSVNSGDKDVIRQQILLANPNIDPKTLESATKRKFEERQYAIRWNKYQQGQQASNAYAMIKNGTRWKDIPDTEKMYLDPMERAGFEEYDRRLALGSFITDSKLYGELAYNNDYLKEVPWAQFYSYAGRLTPQDFDSLKQRKEALEKGASTKDTLKGIATTVDNTLQRLIGAPNANDKRIYNVMKRKVVEYVSDEINANPTAQWDDAKIRALINNKVTESFTVPSKYLWNSDFVLADALKKHVSVTNRVNSLQKVLDAGLNASGFPAPVDLDRQELLVGIILDTKKRVPGCDKMFDKIKEVAPSDYKALLSVYGSNGEIDKNFVVTRYIMNCIAKQ